MINNTIHSATIEVITSFHDTDAMGVVWHGNYLKFFEKAREALFKKFNYGYKEMLDSGYVWPIIDTRVKYVVATIAEQTLQITVQLAEYENRIKLNYIVRDAITGKKTTTGYTIQVAVNTVNKEMSFVTPPIFLERFGLIT